MQKYVIFCAHHLCLFAFLLFHVPVSAQTPSRNIALTLKKDLIEKAHIRGLIFSDEVGKVEAFYQLEGTVDYFTLRLKTDNFDSQLRKPRQRNLIWDLIGCDQTEVRFLPILFTSQIFAAFPKLKEVHQEYSRYLEGDAFQIGSPLPESSRQDPYLLLSRSWQAKNILNSRGFSLSDR